MSGIGGSTGDSALTSLLNLIGNPTEYQAKLAELKATQEAADQATKGLATASAQIEKDKALIAEQKAVISKNVQDFDATQTAVLEKEKGFADRETAVSARETAVAKAEQELEEAKKAFEAITAASSADLTARETAVVGQEQGLAARQNDLLSREKLVADKLAKLKELAG